MCLLGHHSKSGAAAERCVLRQLRVVLERKLERSIKLRHSVKAEQYPDSTTADRQGLAWHWLQQGREASPLVLTKVC